MIVQMFGTIIIGHVLTEVCFLAVSDRGHDQRPTAAYRGRAEEAGRGSLF